MAPSSKSESNFRMFVYRFSFVWSFGDKEGGATVPLVLRVSLSRPLIKAEIQNCAWGSRTNKDIPYLM